MKSVNLKCSLDFEKKVFLCVFWTTRKASNIEGCASFHIKKITTPDNVYTKEDNKRLNLSSEILSEIQRESSYFKPFNIEMHIGEEVLNTYFENRTFSISASKNKELEEEITDKLGVEFEKKYPRICPDFVQRIYK